MARIPASEIERLTQEVSVHRLAEARGVSFHPHGDELRGHCPFHDDPADTLVILPRTNRWECPGCHAGGTAIDWVMRAEGVSVRHAVELLRGNYQPAAAPPDALPPRATSIQKLPTLLDPDADDQALLQQVVAYYHATLQTAPEALGYLADRGLDSAELRTRFQLGFANRTLGYRLPQKTRRAGATLRGRLQRLGLLRASGHEHFNGALVVPILAVDGTVVQLYGCKITPGLRPGTPREVTLPGPPRGLWNEAALAASPTIILCTSLFDALTFWGAGFPHVTASSGEAGLSEDLQAAFRRHGTTTVYLAYPHDPAGERAARAAADWLLAQGLACFRVRFPPGQDAQAVVRHGSSAAASLGVALETAAWMGTGPAPRPRPAAGPTTPPGTASPPGAAAWDASADTNAHDAQTPRCANAPEMREPSASASTGEASVPPPSSAGSAPVDDLPTDIQGDEIVLRQGDRRYRIRGLAKNLSYALLKVNLLVSGPAPGGGSGFHVDTLDLYAARQRAAFVAQASAELQVPTEVLRRELGRVLLKLEELQEAQIAQALSPPPAESAMSAAERAAALDLLQDPCLLDRIQADFARCGVVGEATNTLVGYLAAVSRLLEAPLALLIQSSSAAGKSWLLDAVLAFVPEEHRVEVAAITGQALFYLGEQELRHKILAVAEEEGAQRATYALKLLQSAGGLTIASTGKDATTGRLITHRYRVEGPVMLCLTSTAIDLDEELVSRCLVLTVDEGRAQTAAIHQQQREAHTLDGLRRRGERAGILTVHRNAQRLLQPLVIVNPYAPTLTFLDCQIRTRRDHRKYLTLIQAITLLHQYQRPKRTLRHGDTPVEYLEVTLADIAAANRLAHEVLGRSLDELPPQTRRLLTLLDALVEERRAAHQMQRADVRFSRRDVREATGWGDTQLRVHLGRLTALEYLLVHRGGRGQRFVYELVVAPPADGRTPVLPGLLAVEALVPPGAKPAHDDAGRDDEAAAPSRGQRGPVAAGARATQPPDTICAEADSGEAGRTFMSRGPQDLPVVPVARVKET